MKKTAVLFALCIFLFSTNVHAANWIFFYPGEAGSTAEAQPVIDEFFDYLKSKDNNLDFKGAYFNDVAGGLSYIRSKKPTAGVLSYAIWDMKRSDFPGARVILSTLPTPYGKSTDQYALVGTEPVSDNGLPLFVSEPLSDAFVRSKLLPDLPSSLKLTQTNSILKKIKDIANGNIKGYALLTATEAYTLSKMKSDWAKKLKELARSKPVPTARVILFAPSYKNADAMKKTLLDMKNDPDGVDILDSLRLKGFSSP